MRTTMVIDSPEDYQAWLKEQQEVASNDPEAIVASRIVSPVSEMTDQEYLAGKVAQIGGEHDHMMMKH